MNKLRNRDTGINKMAVIQHYISEIKRVVGREPVRTRDRKHGDVIPRQILYYFLYEYTNMPLTQMSKIFSQNHSTILSGVKKMRTAVKYKYYENDYIQQIQIFRDAGYFCVNCGCQRYNGIDL